MPAELLFGDQAEREEFQALVDARTAEDGTTEDGLFWFAIASVMYCPAVIASVAVAC
jgi:hypothetical protein